MRHASIVIALIALVPMVADAKPKKGKGGKKSPKVEAKMHMEKGAKAHKAGKFDVALTELQAAYALDPQPKLLFAIAQVQAKLDNCPEAVANYEKFLESTKDKQKKAVVKQAIDACNKKIAAAPPPPGGDALAEPAGTTPPPAEPTPPPATTPPPAEAPLPPAVPDNDSPFGGTPMQPAPQPVVTVGGGKPWYKDALGDALLVSGLAAGAVSIVMYTGARSTLDDAEMAPSLDEYDSLKQDAEDKRMYAVILAGGSAVLITAAVLRYKLRDKGEARGVALTPTKGGGLITWSGGF